VDFFRWVRDQKPDDQRAQEGARFYAQMYGTWAWPAAWQAFTEITKGGAA